jgi:hypothetical protein
VLAELGLGPFLDLDASEARRDRVTRAPRPPAWLGPLVRCAVGGRADNRAIDEHGGATDGPSVDLATLDRRANATFVLARPIDDMPVNLLARSPAHNATQRRLLPRRVFVVVFGSPQTIVLDGRRTSVRAPTWAPGRIAER